MLINHLPNFSWYFNNVFKIRLIAFVHSFTYLKNVILTIQNYGVFSIIKNCIDYSERDIKSCLEFGFHSIFNTPSVIPICINSIQKVIIFAPNKLFNFFTNRKTLQCLIIFNCLINITFRTILPTNNY